MVKLGLVNGGEKLVPNRAIVWLQPVTCMTRPKKIYLWYRTGFVSSVPRTKAEFSIPFKSRKVLHAWIIAFIVCT